MIEVKINTKKLHPNFKLHNLFTKVFLFINDIQFIGITVTHAIFRTYNMVV